MLKSENTFHYITGTNITAKTTLEYCKLLSPTFNSKSKTERNIKRKVDKLLSASEDVIKSTDFLLDHIKVKELATAEAESIEMVLFLAAGLDINKRQLVIDYISELNKEVAA